MAARAQDVAAQNVPGQSSPAVARAQDVAAQSVPGPSFLVAARAQGVAAQSVPGLSFPAAARAQDAVVPRRIALSAFRQNLQFVSQVDGFAANFPPFFLSLS